MMFETFRKNIEFWNPVIPKLEQARLTVLSLIILTMFGLLANSLGKVQTFS